MRPFAKSRSLSLASRISFRRKPVAGRNATRNRATSPGDPCMDSAATRSRSISASSSTRTGFDTGLGSRTCLFFRRFVNRRVSVPCEELIKVNEVLRLGRGVQAAGPLREQEALDFPVTEFGRSDRGLHARGMVRRFLAFRTRVPSERYGLIACKYTPTADEIVVRAIPGSTRFVSAVSSFRALFPTGLGAPMAPCWESWFPLSAHELSPSSCAERICRYGGLEVSA